MVQTRHHLTANESIHGVDEEPVKSNKSNQSHNESSHGTWIGKAWQKVENATASVAHAVSEVGQEAWNGTKEAWNSTKGMAEKLWDGNHSAKKSDDAGNTSADEVTKSKTCFTVKTEADSWFTKVAAAGSHCVFGVDTLDEGYHCIEQGGDFGPNGWCWTSKDRSAWGRCSDDCPLTGPQKVLAEKLAAPRHGFPMTVPRLRGPRGPPGPALALRQRLARQADDALALPEHPLRRLLEAAPGTREEEKQLLLEAEQLLLARPKVDVVAVQSRVPAHEEPMNLQALRKAAEDGDLQSMARMDLRLQGALEEDEAFRNVGGTDFQNPKAKAALRLYQDSVTMGRRHGNIDREAFQAVMHDDPESLRQLIGLGLDIEGTRNAGGHSLLQLAQERGKDQCAQVLLREGAKV